jgi:hypothetical protein
MSRSKVDISQEQSTDQLGDAAYGEGVQESSFVQEDEDDSIDGLPSTAFSPINFNVTNRQIRDLHLSYSEGELDTSPAFQRGYVWDSTKASRLIESVLLHVPLPLVYTAEDSEGREVVIDGQQRLMTFFGFLSGKFPRGDGQRPFKLNQLKILKDLNGLSFSELRPDLQRAFRAYGVQVIKISSSTNEDVKFEIFERLNTGAVTLSAHELRNCIYRGPLNETIRRLSKHPAFVRALAVKSPPQRMIDAELVLRFLAFFEKTHFNYPGKMKNFMNSFMKGNRFATPDRQVEWEEKFVLACNNAYTVFGDKAFRRFLVGSARNPNGAWETSINRALFDCVMFWFARYEQRQIIPVKDQIRERFIGALSSDVDFINSITLGTSDASRVKRRFEIFQGIVDSIVSVTASERRSFTISEKKTLFDRDPTCGVCGNRVEMIDDAEVDHVIPYSAGGATSLQNARLAHRFCNRSRGDSELPSQKSRE